MSGLQRYAHMGDDELDAAIRQAKLALGTRLALLVHHYQRDEVIRFADFRGDSLDLSRRAAQANDADFIVFCGVYFMAETAAILCRPGQIVVQPAIEAGCPMANMATAADAARAWAALSSLWGSDLLPITYQNSTAEIKAFVGEQGGAVCTSSNAGKLFAWALAQRGHLLFLPDEHLGTNTALSLGIPREQIAVWDPIAPPEATALAHCRVVVWKGYCHVHTKFTPEDVATARASYPGCRIIVHPECPAEVVAGSDASGSTAAIIQYVEQAPVGATIVIGTEWHLVNRLQQEHPDKVIKPLFRSTCMNMAMTTAKHLLYALESILEGQPRNVVTVDAQVARWARVALERMLSLR
jgi:quinolinate synthase